MSVSPEGLKKLNWLVGFAGLVGVFFTILSYYESRIDGSLSYALSLRSIDLSWQFPGTLDSVGTKLGLNEDETDLILVRLAFWNDGRLSLQGDWFREPLKVEVSSGRLIFLKLGSEQARVSFQENSPFIESDKVVNAAVRYLDPGGYAVMYFALASDVPTPEVRIGANFAGLVKVSNMCDRIGSSYDSPIWLFLLLPSLLFFGQIFYRLGSVINAELSKIASNIVLFPLMGVYSILAFGLVCYFSFLVPATVFLVASDYGVFFAASDQNNYYPHNIIARIFAEDYHSVAECNYLSSLRETLDPQGSLRDFGP